MAGDEQRRDPRVPLVVECQVEGISGRASMRLSDLSVGGCYVDVASAISEGSQVSLHTTLGGRPVVLTGVVAHSKQGVGFGVRFDPLPNHVIELIKTWWGDF
jgi:PilZ domain